MSLALLLTTSMLLSGCLRRPDFMIRVDPAAVPLAEASRDEIAARANSLEQRLASGELRGGSARDARLELERLRSRLEKGDFQIGDQLIVTVTREQTQVDTATVREGMNISLTALPDASLAGVLRSELQQRLQAHVDRYLVDHRVRTNILTRLQVLGAVGTPGFHSISPDRPVSELITIAGGPSPLARLDQVNIRRSGRLIVKPSMWQAATRSGTTVAQLGLQSGDVVEVEAKKQRDALQVLQFVAFAATGLFAVLQLLRFLYEEPE